MIGLIALVFIIALSLVFAWLHARGKFMFIHALATNHAAVVEPWKEFRSLGNSLFVAQMVIGLVQLFAFLVLGVLALAIAWSDIRAQTFGPPAITAIIVGVVLFLPLAIASGFVGSVVDFVIAPGMYARRESFMPTWRAAREEILRPHLGSVVLFILLRWVLAIGASITIAIATCCTCCITVLPYLGTVILLPVFVFLECCSLYFVQQAGGRWRFLSTPQAP